MLSRCGVRPDIAELCLGHRIGGIRGVYDRHEFIDEKRAAFEALAGLIERIVRPVDTVVPIGAAQMTKGSKRGPVLLPTQVLAPSLVVDNEEAGQVEREQRRALGRNLGAEKKHRDAQFAAEARAMIDEHPHVKASTLATWLQSESETKSLPGVTRRDGKPMEHRSLAKKIIRYRQQK